MRAVVGVLLVVALASCGDDGGSGDLNEFCGQVERLSTNDPFASFGDTAEPAEMRAAFDALVERADALVDPAPPDIAGAANRYGDATRELERLLAAAGYDGRNVDVLAYGNAQVDYDEARRQIQRFADGHCGEP